METCEKLYSWLCRTAGLIILQMVWNLSQLPNLFANKKAVVQDDQFRDQLTPLPFTLKPLKRNPKNSRHNRSMSDVISSFSYQPPRTPRRHSQLYEDLRARRPSRINTCDSDSSNSDVPEMRWKASAIIDKTVSVRCIDVNEMRYLSNGKAKCV